MHDITITIRHNGEKHTVPTQNTIILDDLLQQLAGRGILASGQGWVVTKLNENTALDLGLSLVDNHVSDGDTLELASPTKAGA